MSSCLSAGVARYPGRSSARERGASRGGLERLGWASASASLSSVEARPLAPSARRSASAPRLRPARALEDAAWEQAEHEGSRRRLRAPRVEPVIQHCLRAFLAHAVDELVQYLPDATVDRCLDLQDFAAAAQQSGGPPPGPDARPPLTLADALAASRDIPGELFVDARASRALVLSRPRRAAVRSSLRASPGRHLVRLAVVGSSGEAVVATLELRLEETLAPSYCGAGVEVQWVLGRLTAELDGREERWEEEASDGSEAAAAAGPGLAPGSESSADEAQAGTRAAEVRSNGTRVDKRFVRAGGKRASGAAGAEGARPGSRALAWNPMGGDPRPEIPPPWCRDVGGADAGATGGGGGDGNAGTEGRAVSHGGGSGGPLSAPPPPSPSPPPLPARLFAPPVHALGPSPHLGPEECVLLLLSAVRAGQLGPARRWLSAAAKRQLPDAGALRAALREREGSALLAHAGARIAAVTQEGSGCAKVVAEVVSGPGRSRRYEFACVLEQAGGRAWRRAREVSSGPSGGVRGVGRRAGWGARTPHSSAGSASSVRSMFAASNAAGAADASAASGARSASSASSTSSARSSLPASGSFSPRSISSDSDAPSPCTPSSRSPGPLRASSSPPARVPRVSAWSRRAARPSGRRARVARARATRAAPGASPSPLRALRRRARAVEAPTAGGAEGEDEDRVWVVDELRGVDDDDDWAWDGQGGWALPQ